MASRPKKFVHYDIKDFCNEDLFKQFAKEENIDYEFRKQNVIGVDIEKFDLLFIDDYHSYSHVKIELLLNAPKIKKYIIKVNPDYCLFIRSSS